MKKDWKTGSSYENQIERGTLGKSQLGQLLTYMLGHAVQNCSRESTCISFEPVLGLYMEGSKVCIRD